MTLHSALVVFLFATHVIASAPSLDDVIEQSDATAAAFAKCSYQFTASSLEGTNTTTWKGAISAADGEYTAELITSIVIDNKSEAVHYKFIKRNDAIVFEEDRFPGTQVYQTGGVNQSIMSETAEKLIHGQCPHPMTSLVSGDALNTLKSLKGRMNAEWRYDTAMFDSKKRVVITMMRANGQPAWDYELDGSLGFMLVEQRSYSDLGKLISRRTIEYARGVSGMAVPVPRTMTTTRFGGTPSRLLTFNFAGWSPLGPTKESLRTESVLKPGRRVFVQNTTGGIDAFKYENGRMVTDAGALAQIAPVPGAGGPAMPERPSKFRWGYLAAGVAAFVLAFLIFVERRRRHRSHGVA